MRAESTRRSNRRPASTTERLGALPQRAVEGQDPPEEAPPGEPDGVTARFTAVDEELVGGSEDPAMAAVAAVREKSAIAIELLTP